MDRGKVLTALQALAHDSRLDLVHLLMPHGDDGLSAGDISRALGMAASRLSFHLAALEQAGLLRSRKQARNVFYAVDTAGMGSTIGYLLNDCCRDHPTVRACCQGAAPDGIPVKVLPES
jgi:DNA-binding transcriptional ArsR family regulator